MMPEEDRSIRLIYDVIKFARKKQIFTSDHYKKIKQEVDAAVRGYEARQHEERNKS